MPKTPVKQLPGKLQSAHTQFVEQYSPKDTITSTSEGESESLPLDIKDNIQREISSNREWSSTSYNCKLTVAHTLGVYGWFDVSPRHKARAIRTLTCCPSGLIHTRDLVQPNMQSLGSRDHQTNNNCHESDDSLSSSDVEELDNNCSEQQLPASTGLMIKNNLDYTSVAESDHCAEKHSKLVVCRFAFNIPRESSQLTTVCVEVTSEPVVTGVRSPILTSVPLVTPVIKPSLTSTSLLTLGTNPNLANTSLVMPQTSTNLSSMSVVYSGNELSLPSVVLVVSGETGTNSNKPPPGDYKSSQTDSNSETYYHCKIFSWLVGIFNPPGHLHKFFSWLVETSTLLKTTAAWEENSFRSLATFSNQKMEKISPVPRMVGWHIAGGFYYQIYPG